MDVGKIFKYTNPKTQRNSGLFCKFCTSRTCIHLNVSINIMPSYLSIASNISFNHQCLELEETTNFVEVGCLKKRIAWYFSWNRHVIFIRTLGRILRYCRLFRFLWNTHTHQNLRVMSLSCLVQNLRLIDQ